MTDPTMIYFDLTSYGQDDWLCSHITWEVKCQPPLTDGENVEGKVISLPDHRYDPHAHALPTRMQPQGRVDFTGGCNYTRKERLLLIVSIPRPRAETTVTAAVHFEQGQFIELQPFTDTALATRLAPLPSETDSPPCVAAPRSEQ